MTADAAASTPPRTPLSRERVLRAAIGVADERGAEAVTMRRLAEVVGTEAMSLYYHVNNKEDVLDGVVDLIVQEINDVVGALPPGDDWRATVRARILAARQVLLRHPWAPRVIESRTATGPAVLAYHNDLVGLLHAGGFTYDLIHHGLHALGSRALGFTQELFDPAGSGGDQPPPDDLAAMAEQLPHLVAMLADVAHDDPASTLGWCDDQTEFEFGLDIVLDGLARLRT